MCDEIFGNANFRKTRRVFFVKNTTVKTRFFEKILRSVVVAGKNIGYWNCRLSNQRALCGGFGKKFFYNEALKRSFRYLFAQCMFVCEFKLSDFIGSGACDEYGMGRNKFCPIAVSFVYYVFQTCRGR